ncbi:MAG: Ribonuclease [Deltaproteobacteria bacterium]|jgi:ribonuclease P protein component|nr:Ribonuclease [Deltaproteobacteria bacterium]
MPQTFGKNERVNRRRFKRARWVRRAATAHFLLFESSNQDSGKRFGVVIQRKIKGVVARNRIRRLAREFFRLNKDLFRERHDYHVRVVRMPEKPRYGLVESELLTLVSGGIVRQ